MLSITLCLEQASIENMAPVEQLAMLYLPYGTAFTHVRFDCCNTVYSSVVAFYIAFETMQLSFNLIYWFRKIPYKFIFYAIWDREEGLLMTLIFS